MTMETNRGETAQSDSHPRAGWAEDAKRLAALGDDTLVWPEFANEDDSALDW